MSSEMLQTVFMTTYTIMLAIVSLYGLHRYVIVFLYMKHRKNEHQPAGQFDELPRVTIQLPMFNEKFVARRIIEKTCEMDYPRDKLQIQVLDDSTDDTADLAREVVEEMKAKGIDIEFIHREDRTGFKAGALEHGMKTATGEFISIFDADFMPEPTFLMDSIQYFTDPKVCVVQTRWEHINRDDSLLTKSQAIFLDGHFAIEHVGRNRSGRFMSFNGTGGTWRRSAIEDAGGWCHDTLTEDLDLSYRAQLKGWKFIFLPDKVSPAELPPEMAAFKAQQFRWTKGGAQNAIKLLPQVMKAKIPLKVKVEAFFHLTGFCMHIFMLGLVLMMYPAMYLKTLPLEAGTAWRVIVDMGVFALATMSATVFYCASQGALTGNWRKPLNFLPVMMGIGVGLCVNNTKAIIEAIMGRQSAFIRTPKYGEEQANAYADMTPDKPVKTKKSKSKFNWVGMIEFLLGCYMLLCLVLCLMDIRTAITGIFLLMFAFGFFYVSLLSYQAGKQKSKAADKDAACGVVEA